MQIFIRPVIFYLLFAILVGCNTFPSTDYPTTITPTHATLSATATKEPQRLPTATRRPSATPSPSPTIDLTETVIYQDMLTAQAMAETLAVNFPRVCEYSYGSPEFSPNQLWMAASCFSEKDQDNILSISNKDSQVLWKFEAKDYLPPMEFPEGILLIVHWAMDERYVYFLSSSGGSGAECFYFYRGRERGKGLFRLDLQSGQTNAVFSPNNGWYSFAFSPTDRRLVYGSLARDLKILDLTTGEIIDIASGSDNYESGGYLWSPDGLHLVYSVLTYDDQGEVNYSLRLVDARSGLEQILFEAPDQCFSALSWTTNDIFVIERYGNDGRILIEYDLNTNIRIPESTATP